MVSFRGIVAMVSRAVRQSLARAGQDRRDTHPVCTASFWNSSPTQRLQNFALESTFIFGINEYVITRILS